MNITHIRYIDAQGNRWTRLSRPGQLDHDLEQLHREEKATIVTITNQTK